MRAAVTILAIVVGLSFVTGVYFRSAHTSTPTPAITQPVQVTDGQTDAPDAPSAQSPPSNQTDQANTANPADVATDQNGAQNATATTNADTTKSAATSAASTQQASTKPATTKPVAASMFDTGKLTPAPADVSQSSTIGSADPQSPYTMEVELTAWGAGVRSIKLSKYTETALQSKPYTVLSSIPMETGGQTYSYYPFAARNITVNNQTIALEGLAWHLKSPGVYTLDLLANGKPAIRLTRQYALTAGPDSYEVQLKQNVQNLTAHPVSVVWEQSIQAEMETDHGSYMGDQRRLFVGYYNPKYDPARKYVIIDGSYEKHATVLKAYNKNEPFFWPLKDVPNGEMVWFGEANRYFVSVVHRPVLKKSVVQTSQPASTSAGAPAVGMNPDKVQPLDQLFPHLGLRVVYATPAPAPSTTTQPANQPAASATPVETLIYSLTSKPLTIAPNHKANLDLAIFAGPRQSGLFENQPYAELGFNNLIQYELSCAFCTFQWLAKGLLQFLKGIHYVLHDWAMAIIILVLVVRLILHPITKKSQIAMTKMGKQMATLKPEMDKIKAKYADDQTRQNQEVMKLYRERGINPAGMLGCLPMFLQTPIWIALYAMLYFAIELRHEPAFYGVFQSLSGGHWAFLADLSTSDNFLHFSKSVTLNLYFVHPQFSGINIIPLLMAVFFYLQQMMMMPPAANEQQAQQQKIGKYMTLMVPIFLYSAPSGLTLYMLASSIGGMIDGYIVRRHIKRQEEDGTLFKPKPPKETKPGGIWDRIQKGLAAQQEKITQQTKLKQQQQQLQNKKKKKHDGR